MVPPDFGALSARRAERARRLAERYHSAGEVLRFYSELAMFQRRIFPAARDREALPAFGGDLIEVVEARGPERLRSVAGSVDEGSLRRALDDYWRQLDTASPMSFFARVLLQAHAAYLQAPEADRRSATIAESCCPRCTHRPQVGVLRPVGDGSALALVCSLCFFEWPFSRAGCPGCGEVAESSLTYSSAPGYEHVQVESCEACGIYLHVIDLGKEPEAIPEVDELAALPLDVWARERGYRKLQPNLAGI